MVSQPGMMLLVKLKGRRNESTAMPSRRNWKTFDIFVFLNYFFPLNLTSPNTHGNEPNALEKKIIQKLEVIYKVTVYVIFSLVSFILEIVILVEINSYKIKLMKMNMVIRNDELYSLIILITGVPLEVLLTFNRLKALSTDCSLIAGAIRNPHQNYLRYNIDILIH